MKAVVSRLRAGLPGVRVIGATLTPATGSTNANHGFPEQEEKRVRLNAFIRTSGIFDGVADFDKVIADPATGAMRPEFVHNTTIGGDGDKLHPESPGLSRDGHGDRSRSSEAGPLTCRRGDEPRSTNERHMRPASFASALIAVVSGAGLWIWAAAAAGKVEAWDGPFYFSRVVPALGIIAGLCGALAPRHAWRWPALMYAAQWVAMLARTQGPIGPLAPVGFIMMLVLAIATAVPTYVGVIARKWASNPRAEAPGG